MPVAEEEEEEAVVTPEPECEKELEVELAVEAEQELSLEPEPHTEPELADKCPAASDSPADLAPSAVEDNRVGVWSVSLFSRMFHFSRNLFNLFVFMKSIFIDVFRVP